MVGVEVVPGAEKAGLGRNEAYRGGMTLTELSEILAELLEVGRVVYFPEDVWQKNKR